MTGNEHDAEDVVQEAFLRAYRGLERFEDRSQVGSWLYRIAANCAYEEPLEGQSESALAAVAFHADPARTRPWSAGWRPASR